MPWKDRPTFSASRELFDDVAVDLPELFAAQQRWAAEQDTSLAEYFRKQAARMTDADEQIALMARADSITGHWPLVPYETHQTSAAPDLPGSRAATAPTK